MRLSVVAALCMLGACGGQDPAAPCVYNVNVFDEPQVQVGATIPIELEISVKSGKCTVQENINVIWSSSNTNIAEIETQTNTTATVHAKKQGSAFITAWLALAPSTRDSITLNVSAPVDQ